MNIDVNGPLKSIVFTVGGHTIVISETVVTGWFIIAALLVVCLLLTRGLKKVPDTKRQSFAEMLVSYCNNMVSDNMGSDMLKFAPYIGTIFVFALIGSLCSLLGFRSMTADINVTGTWAVLTFILITYYKIKTQGIGKYLLSFVNPLNIISEAATPVSMALRLFANVSAGMLITMILYAALGSASTALYSLLGFTPDVSYFNIFQIGIPAVLSVYFDLFSGTIQAYVFIMLTMAYVKSARE